MQIHFDSFFLLLSCDNTLLQERKKKEEEGRNRGICQPQGVQYKCASRGAPLLEQKKRASKKGWEGNNGKLFTLLLHATRG